VIGIEDVRAAAGRIAGVAHRTPVLTSRTVDALAGAAVLAKAECFQRGGAFKFRGAYNAIASLSPETRAAGVLAYSSGNHAQAIALAAKLHGIPAVIVMPYDAPPTKAAATAGYGAELVRYDRYEQVREDVGRELATERGLTLIPPYDHPDVIAGQGTVALELVEDARPAGLPPLDALAVCTGGGGLVAGCALAMEAMAPGAEVWAVEPEGWDDTKRSLEAGERLANDGAGSGFCDALLSRRPGALTFPINRRLLAGAAVVTEAEVLRAMRFAFEHLKLVVEPGGAVGRWRRCSRAGWRRAGGRWAWCSAAATWTRRCSRGRWRRRKRGNPGGGRPFEAASRPRTDRRPDREEPPAPCRPAAP
jgi:threonine dehydratase